MSDYNINLAFGHLQETSSIEILTKNEVVSVVIGIQFMSLILSFSFSCTFCLYVYFTLASRVTSGKHQLSLFTDSLWCLSFLLLSHLFWVYSFIFFSILIFCSLVCIFCFNSSINCTKLLWNLYLWKIIFSSVFSLVLSEIKPECEGMDSSLLQLHVVFLFLFSWSLCLL